MKRLIAVLIGVVLAVPTVTMADDDNTSACGAVLCLAGLIDGGQAGGDCKQYMTGYFSIVKFHHGHFDLSGTANARSNFTGQCHSIGPDTQKSVNDRYGSSESGP